MVAKYNELQAKISKLLDADTRKLLQKRHSSQVFTMLKNIIQK